MSEEEKKLRPFLAVYCASGLMESTIGNVEVGLWDYPLTMDDIRALEAKIRKQEGFSRVAIINIIPLATVRTSKQEETGGKITVSDGCICRVCGSRWVSEDSARECEKRHVAVDSIQDVDFYGEKYPYFLEVKMQDGTVRRYEEENGEARRRRGMPIKEF